MSNPTPTSTTVTVQATSAINLTGIVSPVNLSPGQYAITLQNDTMTYRTSSIPVQQVIVFNTAPLKTGNYEKWFYTVNTSEGTVITVQSGQPVYAFIVDQISSTDNTGSVNVVFTPL
jgi:hypothetical protein